MKSLGVEGRSAGACAGIYARVRAVFWVFWCGGGRRAGEVPSETYDKEGIDQMGSPMMTNATALEINILKQQ